MGRNKTKEHVYNLENYQQKPIICVKKKIGELHFTQPNISSKIYKDHKIFRWRLDLYLFKRIQVKLVQIAIKNNHSERRSIEYRSSLKVTPGLPTNITEQN